MGDILMHYPIEGIMVIQLLETRIVDQFNISQIQKRIFEVVDESQYPRFVMNMEKIEYLSSGFLSTLIALQKKIQKDFGKNKGQLSLCCIRPDVLEVFTITQLDKFFAIKESEKDAIAFLKGIL